MQLFTLLLSQKKFLDNKNINVSPWSPRFSDLNPIENIVGIIDKKIRKETPQNLEELNEKLLKEWRFDFYRFMFFINIIDTQKNQRVY